MEQVSRRQFLARSFSLAVFTYLSRFASIFGLSGRDIPRVEKKNQIAFYVDINACVGCRACTAACQEYYRIPFPLRFRSVYAREGKPSEKDLLGVRMYMSLACNHCEEPSCLKGCPTKSYTKRARDGIVVHDQNRCIGCKYCTWNCPYGVPQFNPNTHKIFKCEFCVERLEKDQKPLCTSSCIAGAIDFGTIEELENKYGPLLAKKPEAFLYPDTNISKPTTLFAPPRKEIPLLKPIRDRATDKEVML